jgi:hypothetical protein
VAAVVACAGLLPATARAMQAPTCPLSAAGPGTFAASVVRPGFAEVDKSGDRLTLECVPVEDDQAEWDEPSPDNQCVQSAPCCGQPEALGIAPNTHCCKVGPTTGICCHNPPGEDLTTQTLSRVSCD